MVEQGDGTRIGKANVIRHELHRSVVSGDKTGTFKHCHVKAVFFSDLHLWSSILVMIERVLSKVQAEIGFLRRVHCVTLRNKLHSYEIRKVLNVEPLLWIGRTRYDGSATCPECSRKIGKASVAGRGETRSSFRGAIFMKLHSMTSSCLFNRGTTFSQTVTYNNNVFLPLDTKSIVQTHTFCTMLVNKNRLNRTFYNSVGGWITGVKRNFWLTNIWLHVICACTEQHSIYQIRWENWWLGLRIWCLVKRIGLAFILQLEKEK